MTPLLKLLEKKKFITRQMLAGNERQKNIALTPEGKALSDKSKAITDQAFCATGLSRQQAEELIESCKAISMGVVES